MKKNKSKSSGNDFVRTSDLKRIFSKGDTTNWSYKLCEITDIVNDTMPSYRTDNLQECYKEAFLKKTEFSIKENNNVMKKSNIT